MHHKSRDLRSVHVRMYTFVHVHRAGGNLVYVGLPCAFVKGRVGVKKVRLPLGRFSLMA